jgi:hypothetical protein
MIADEHWKALAETEPGDVCARALCAWDDEENCYRLPFLGRELRVSPAGRSVTGPDGGSCGFPETLVSVVYLLSARDCPLAGAWVSPQALPYGDVFFRGPHQVDTDGLARRFGPRPEELTEAGRRLGGEPMTFGDASVQLPALPRVPVCIVLWRGDDEFPAGANLLVDRSAADHLPLDALWMLLIAACKACKEP